MPQLGRWALDKRFIQFRQEPAANSVGRNQAEAPGVMDIQLSRQIGQVFVEGNSQENILRASARSM